jgi:hypothetical protein
MQLGQRKPRIPCQRISHLLHLLSNGFEYQGKIPRLSTLMVGTQQVQEYNDMQGKITKAKLYYGCKQKMNLYLTHKLLAPIYYIKDVG